MFLLKLISSLNLVLGFFTIKYCTNKIIFASWKIVKRKKKTGKKNNFLIFDFIIKNIKKKTIKYKVIRNLYILKLFNLYIIKENKLNKYKKVFKNNLLTL